MASERPRGRPPHDDVLTPAEWRAVHAAQHGMTNREIAARRGVSVDAIKYHLANARAKLGVTSKRALRSWFGAPNASALQKREKILNAQVKLGPIGQISRSVSDITKAKEWYGGILGLQHLYTFGTLAFYDCGGTRLFLMQDDKTSSGESILYLRVDDIETAYEDLKARGIEFTNSPHMIHKHEDGTEEWMAFFNDPDGRPLAIMSQTKA